MIFYETKAWQSCPGCWDSTQAGRQYFFTSVLKAQQFWEEHVPGLKWKRLITCYVANGQPVSFRADAKHPHAGHTHTTGYNILRHEVE